MKSRIDIHVDDYAITLNASRTIIELARKKKINSISVIPNMKCFEESMKELNAYFDTETENTLKASVHLNFMEGYPCAASESVDLLIGEDGIFNSSWGKLFFYSMNPFSFKKVKRQLKTEIRAQIQRMKEYMPQDYTLRIDSHQHTHVIPIVWDALKEIMIEDQLDVEYIRIPREPLWPYLKKVKLYKTYSPVNLIKNVVLNFLSILTLRFMKDSGIKHSFVWGILMSGEMDANRIMMLLKEFKAFVVKKESNLEIFFHAGIINQDELGSEYSKSGFKQFHLSENRKTEWQSIDTLQGKWGD